MKIENTVPHTSQTAREYLAAIAAKFPDECEAFDYLLSVLPAESVRAFKRSFVRALRENPKFIAQAMPRHTLRLVRD